MSRLKILPLRALSRLLAPRSTLPRPGTVVRVGILVMLVVQGACAAVVPELPPSRPIVIHSGARIRSDPEHMKEVNEWVTREQRNIEEDPSFLVVGESSTAENFPWEGMVLGQDTVTIRIPLGGSDAALVYQIYGHLHLMVAMDRQEEWLPEAPTAVGYDLEHAIVTRIADAWILGRTVFDTAPFSPLDELVYAMDAGFLEAFMFTARPGEFAASRAEWVRENPGEIERYRDWFIDTFNREPPGIRAN